MSDNLRVFEGHGTPGHVLAGEMAERIKEVIYDYSGRLPVAAAVGVLEIVKAEILDEQ